MYGLLFTRIPVESYRRRLESLLLYLCHVFRELINSLNFVLILYACSWPRSVSDSFSPFSCCLSVILWLDKEDYPENWHVVFSPYK